MREGAARRVGILDADPQLRGPLGDARPAERRGDVVPVTGELDGKGVAVGESGAPDLDHGASFDRLSTGVGTAFAGREQHARRTLPRASVRSARYRAARSF